MKKSIRRTVIVAALLVLGVALIFQLPPAERVVEKYAASVSLDGLTLSEFTAYPEDVRSAILRSGRLTSEQQGRLWQEHMAQVTHTAADWTPEQQDFVTKVSDRFTPAHFERRRVITDYLRTVLAPRTEEINAMSPEQQEALQQELNQQIAERFGEAPPGLCGEAVAEAFTTEADRARLALLQRDGLGALAAPDHSVSSVALNASLSLLRGVQVMAQDDDDLPDPSPVNCNCNGAGSCENCWGMIFQCTYSTCYFDPYESVDCGCWWDDPNPCFKTCLLLGNPYDPWI